MHSEIKKQLIDQPLHIAMCVFSIAAIGAVLMKVAGLEVLITTIISTLLTCTWVGLREFLQYPPRESAPWDVWLDAAFEIVGIIGGAVLFYLVLGPMLYSSIEPIF